MLLILAVAGKV